MTSFNQLTFFQADINQSEVKDSFQLASDWIASVRKNKWAPCCKLIQKHKSFRSLPPATLVILPTIVKHFDWAGDKNNSFRVAVGGNKDP